MGLALHQEEIDLGEHAGEEAARLPVARERARRDAAVHERDARAAPTRLVDEVGPQLRLDEDEQRRVQDVESPAHRVREVEGRVEQPVDAADALLGHRVAGHRGRGEEDAVPREALAQRGDQGPGGQDLADGDGVDPDGPVAVHVQVDGQAAHALPEGPQVFPAWNGPSTRTTAGRGRTRRSGGGYRGCALAAPRAGTARKSGLQV